MHLKCFDLLKTDAVLVVNAWYNYGKGTSSGNQMNERSSVQFVINVKTQLSFDWIPVVKHPFLSIGDRVNIYLLKYFNLKIHKDLFA